MLFQHVVLENVDTLLYQLNAIFVATVPIIKNNFRLKTEVNLCAECIKFSALELFVLVSDKNKKWNTDLLSKHPW